MMYGVAINGLMSFCFTVCVLYCLGDPETALTSPTGYPIIQVAYGATQSKAATIVLMTFIVWNGIISMFSSLASVCRLTWAFARDGGIPFSSFFGTVSLCHCTSVPYLMLMRSTGAPNPSYSAQHPRSRRLYHRSSPTHQYWLHHRALRHPLTFNDRPVLILRPPDHLHHPPQTSGRAHPLWPMETRALRSSHQHLLHRVLHFYSDLAAVSTIHASHGREHELWRTGHGCRYCVCAFGLVRFRTKEVRAANREILQLVISDRI